MKSRDAQPTSSHWKVGPTLAALDLVGMLGRLFAGEADDLGTVAPRRTRRHSEGIVDRDLDIVLFGGHWIRRVADGGTPSHCRGTGCRVRVVLASRSLARLKAVHGQLGEPARDWALAEVDATDDEGLRRLASLTAVVATTVGPYARYGREVVRAAAGEGTHYADLIGEALFVRWTLDEVAAGRRGRRGPGSSTPAASTRSLRPRRPPHGTARGGRTSRPRDLVGVQGGHR